MLRNRVIISMIKTQEKSKKTTMTYSSNISQFLLSENEEESV